MTRPKLDFILPTGSRPAVSTWMLTPIDRYAFQWVIQGTWVFDSRLDASTLKHGLARLLDHYPLLAGRVAGGTRIEWSDTGVPFVEETEPTLNVADFDAACVDVARFAHRFSPSRIRRGAAPLMTLKLTHLRDGCVLAICCSHACLDGNGFYTMARNLARAATGAAFPAPVFERRGGETLRRSRWEVARAARQAGWRRVSPLDIVRFAVARPGLHDRAFVAHFSPAALQRCKETLARDAACPRLSTNSALLAHVAHSLAALVGLADRDRFALSVAVDQRGRASSVPEDFAGNAVAIVVTPPIPARADRAAIAARVHACVEPVTNRPSPSLESLAQLTREVVAHRLPWTPLPRNRLGRRRKLFYTNSFARFPVYDLDFGDESRPVRPVRAIPHNLGDPVILWPSPPPVGGLDVYFSGKLARAVSRVARDHPWWTEMRRFDA
ncbi:MAG TPA: acyltransferase [Gammaproteobacteria bacterium]|nr:acyltransferase [Gammaproteobacteria bacterium]